MAQHCQGSQEDVERTPQQMSLRPFKHFPNCGVGHLRCSSSCHSLSPPLTFGILGCMPCTIQEVGWQQRIFSQTRAGSVLQRFNKEAPLRIILEETASAFASNWNDCTSLLSGCPLNSVGSFQLIQNPVAGVPAGISQPTHSSHTAFSSFNKNSE